MARITSEARKTIAGINAAIRKFEQARKDEELCTNQRAWDAAQNMKEDAVMDLQNFIFTLVGEANMLAYSTEQKYVRETLRLTYTK